MSRESKHKLIKRSSQRVAGQRAAAGFTLIELLVVIVVIAILASISVATYSGIQKRAQTVKYAVAADQIEKALLLSNIATQIPKSSQRIEGCIGQSADFPSRNGFLAGECIRGMDEAPGMIPILSLGQRSSFSMNSDLTSKLNQAKFEYRHSDLPVVKQGWRGAFRGRGIAAAFHWNHQSYNDEGNIIHSYGGDTARYNTLTATLYWLAPDTSTCGRGDGFNQQLLGFLASDETKQAIREMLDDLKTYRDGGMSAHDFNIKYPDSEIEIETMSHEEVDGVIYTYQYMLEIPDDLCVHEIIVHGGPVRQQP